MCALDRSVDWVYLLEMYADIYPGSGMLAVPQHSYYICVCLYAARQSLFNPCISRRHPTGLFMVCTFSSFNFFPVVVVCCMFWCLEPQGEDIMVCYPCWNTKR